MYRVSENIILNLKLDYKFVSAAPKNVPHVWRGIVERLYTVCPNKRRTIV